MVTEEQTKTEFEGYVCPTCRLLFAADLSQVGTSVMCPGCESPVRIPLVGEERETLRKRRARKYVQAGTAMEGDQFLGAGGGRRQHWDRPDESVEKVEGKHSLPWIWIVPAALLGMSLVGVMISVVLSSKPVAPVELEPVVVKPSEKDEAVEKVKTEAEQYDYAKHEVLLEESLKTFLAAKSVEELLPVVRATEGIKEKMEKYYTHHAFGEKRFKKLVNSASLIDQPTVASFAVQLDDYSNRNGVAEFKDGKMLIDWETFVIYSEMPWDTIAEKKPTKPVEIWAVAMPSNYYNFGFKDDVWQAYELISPEEDRSFIGYVKRNGAGQARLTTFGEGSSGVQCVLKIKFPENSLVTNQVEIVEVIRNDWNLEIEEEAK